MNRKVALCLAQICAALVLASAVHAFPMSTPLYVQPTSEPFIENSGETVITVNDTSGSISSAQTALNNAHTSNPSAVVVLNLNAATYSVSSAALNLTSNTCCVLGSGTTIKAASSSITPTCLIQIHGQSDVSVAGGTFNGNGASVNAIQVETSNHINIDDITVEDCARDGIYVTGNGNTTFDNEDTVTRCTVSGGTSNGIKVQNATQAVIIDNNCSSNTGAGIYLGTAHGTVTNNTCTSNGTGIIVTGASNFVSDNECDSNSTGISMTSTSSSNVIASNHAYSSTTVGISEAGTGDTLYENYYKTNTSNYTSSSSGNHHMAYKAAISDPNNDYFYPPILSNQHTTTTIVNGLGRYDLTIGSATIASVQSQYNSARSSHSSDVIVLHLTGTYTVTSSPLTLSSNTCVLLSGTIQASTSTTAASCVNCASGAVHVSFSGGTVDGGSNTALEGVVFSGAGMGWIQGVTIQNFGQTETNSGMIVLTQSAGPLMASSNTVTTVSGRGVWTQGNGPFVITDNTVSSGKADGVDCDYHTAMALVKLNTLSSNFRYGVFFEQGAQYNVGIGNTCSSGLTRGFNIYDNAEQQVTEYNIAACNVCDSNFNGLKSGASGNGANGQPSTCSHNFFFNNTAQNNTGDGIDSEQDGTQNYYGQTILGGNGTDIVTNGAEVFFNSSEP